MVNLKQTACLVLLGAALDCSVPGSSHAYDQRAANLVAAQRDRQRPTAQFCLLGGVDCLALASQPFKACLLATDRCAQDVQVYPARIREVKGE